MYKLWILLILLVLPLTGNAQQVDKFKVAILMFDQVQIIDFAAPYEVFGQAGFDVYTVSKKGEAVTTAMGLHVSPQYSFDDLPNVDALLVPGGDVESVMHDADVRRWLQQRAESAQYVLSVCTGSHILAEAHLLDGLQATTFHKQIDNLQQSYPSINVVDNLRYVDNGKVITSAGLSSGIDAALHLVSEVQGLDAAKTLAHHIEYDWQQEKGYVRAQMADQYFPKNNYQWPEDVKFSELASFGDERYWDRKYSVDTKATAGLLMDVVQQSLAQFGDWKTLPTSTENQRLWQREIDGENWQLKLTTENDGSSTQKTMEIEVYQKS